MLPARITPARRSPGCADAARRVTLTVGSAFDVAVQLTLSGVTASVTVLGEAPILESSRSQIAGTVALAEIQRLPLNGRNFLDIALLVPGVAPPNVAFRIGGRVRADAIVEAFNVTNTTNVRARNANFGTGTYPTNPAPTFGQITAVGDSRSLQLAVKLRF